MKLATHSTATMRDIVSWTRENCVRESGSYKEYMLSICHFQSITLFHVTKVRDKRSCAKFDDKDY